MQIICIVYVINRCIYLQVLDINSNSFIMFYMYECMFTVVEIQYFVFVIDKRIFKIYFCYEWIGLVNKDGYGLYRLCFRGK